jgi:hypothetical protein
MSKNNGHWYIEPTDDGRYSATKGGGQRASAVTNTQKQAIDRAKEIDAAAPMHIAHVRSGKHGPDKYR